MTANETLSIPNARRRASRRLLQEHCDDRMATRPIGKIFPIEVGIHLAAVFKDGGNVATAEEFVRFLVERAG